MRIDVVTLFPGLVAAVRDYGVTGRAVEEGLLELVTWNPREFTRDRHRTADDRPYGGGPGMVMKAQPLAAAVQAARRESSEARVVYLSPQGRRLDQATLRQRAGTDLILVAGRYEGVDERFIEAAVDEEWSIGDYVLSGGELPAMVIIDALARLLPGALGDDSSVDEDSFTEGLLDWPHYTRPEVYAGRPVPSVLLGGHHEAIRRWRRQQALGRTWQRRPDLLGSLELSEEDRWLLMDYRRRYEKAGEEDN